MAILKMMQSVVSTSTIMYPVPITETFEKFLFFFKNASESLRTTSLRGYVKSVNFVTLTMWKVSLTLINTFLNTFTLLINHIVEHIVNLAALLVQRQ